MAFATKNRKEAFRTIAWGVAWLAGAGWFWLATVGNPFHELLLIMDAQIASGQIVDAWEDADEDDTGRTIWSHGYSYTFRVADGRQIFGGTGIRRGRLRPELVNLEAPLPIEIEYISFSSSINRVKGEGSQTVFEWLLRKVGAGGLLLILFVSPGVTLIRNGIRAYRSI